MQKTIVFQSNTPTDLKAKIDDLIATGATIVHIVETVRTFYLVVYTE